MASPGLGGGGGGLVSEGEYTPYWSDSPKECDIDEGIVQLQHQNLRHRDLQVLNTRR